MTTEPRRPDELRPDEDDSFVLEGGAHDELDQAFTDVENEVGLSTSAAGSAPAPQSEADEFSDLDIGDADDVFVIDDDEFGVDVDPPVAPPPVAVPPGRTAAAEPDQEEHLGGRMRLSEDEGDETLVDEAAMFGSSSDDEMSLAPHAEEEFGFVSEEESSVEDELFAAPPATVASERFGEDAPKFDEGSHRDWGGASLSSDEVGINAHDGDGDASLEEDEDWSAGADEELEIVEDDSDAQLAGDFVLTEGDPSEQFGIQPLDEVEVTAPASGVWAGVESATMSASGTYRADQEEEQDSYAEPEYAQHEGALPEEQEGWDEPVAEEDAYDPIYGSDAMPGTESGTYVPAQEEEEPDYSEYEESYVNHGTGTFGSVIGAPVRRRRGFMTVFAAAALILVGVSAGFAFMRPEWLGLGTPPALVDRTMVARPVISLDMQAPAAPEQPIENPPVEKPPVVATNPPVENPPVEKPPVENPPVENPPVVATNPPVENPPVENPPVENPPVENPPVEKPPVVATNPPVENPPVENPPVEKPPVVATNPPVENPPVENPPVVASEPPVVTGPLTEPAPTVAKADDTTRIGDELQIRPAAPAARPRVHHLAEGLVTGSQAFAQLKNMNFFLGRVKAMDSSLLTLDLTPGEITLAFDDLNAIVPLASEEYRVMQGAADGFVRLTNRNKLFGKILNSSLADNVVLEVQKNQVLIPRASVEEIGQQSRSAVQVLEDGDSDWVKTMLQRQATKSTQKSSISAPSPAPGAAPQGGR